MVCNYNILINMFVQMVFWSVVAKLMKDMDILVIIFYMCVTVTPFIQFKGNGLIFVGPKTTYWNIYTMILMIKQTKYIPTSRVISHVVLNLFQVSMLLILFTKDLKWIKLMIAYLMCHHFNSWVVKQCLSGLNRIEQMIAKSINC